MTDFRALCAELLDELDFQSSHHSAVDLKARARAALAQPEPLGATDEVDHILKLAAIIREVDGGNKLGAASLAEAILSHRDNCWGRPAIEPVPVAERLPVPQQEAN